LNTLFADRKGPVVFNPPHRVPEEARKASHPSSGAQTVALGDPLEPHYSVQDIAELWKVDPETVSKVFRSEPGVLALENNHRKDGKRNYTILRIPGSVLRRVYNRRTQKQAGDVSGIAKTIRTRAERRTGSTSKPKPPKEG
jgi:hypothetical protein